MHAGGDRGQALGAVVDGVGAGHDGQQHLGGADVAGRLLAADVLLAGLQRQPVGDVAVGVDRDADQAAGQLAGQALAHRQVAGVRAAVAHRDAEALGGAAGDVGAPLPRRLEQRQGQQVGGDDDGGAGLVRGRGQRPVVADGAAGARVGQQDAEGAGLGQVGRPAGGEVGDVQADAQRLGAGLQDGEGLRQRVGVDDEDGVRPSPGRPARTSVIASAAAVASSSIEAPATSRPVRSATIVWKLISASSRPWLISGW